MAEGWIEQERHYRRYKARIEQLPASYGPWSRRGWAVSTARDCGSVVVHSRRLPARPGRSGAGDDNSSALAR